MPQTASSGLRNWSWSPCASLPSDRWRRQSKHRCIDAREASWRPVFTFDRKPVVPHLQRRCPLVPLSSCRVWDRRDRKRKCFNTGSDQIKIISLRNINSAAHAKIIISQNQNKTAWAKSKEKCKVLKQSGIFYLKIRMILLGRFVFSLRAYILPKLLS